MNKKRMCLFYCLIVILPIFSLAAVASGPNFHPGMMVTGHDRAGLAAGSPERVSAEAAKSYERVMKLRVFEGLRDGGPSPATVISSSYLKHTFSASLESEADLGEIENRIKRTFNLKDVRLLSESVLNWQKGGPKRTSQVFRLDGTVYEIAVTAEDVLKEEFRVEVYEQMDQKKTSLLETLVVLPKKTAAVFGFEDSQGRPYFLALREEAIRTETGVYSLSRPPRLIKMVDPVYPEEARKAGKEGLVVLTARTDIYGKVERVRVEKGVDPSLDRAAVEAVGQWVYEPPVVDGVPQPVEFSVQVKFILDQEKKGRVRGVVGGVSGSVEGGVTGGVSGGVSPGVGKVGSVGVADVAQTEQKVETFAAGAIKVKEGINPPRLIKKVDAVYPEPARLAGVEGVVILMVRTDVTGSVKDAMILRSVPLLDRAAEDAVRQWVYEPLIVDGKAREAVFTVTVAFRLKNGEKKAGEKERAEEQGAIQPRLVRKVEPVYPETARKAGIQGTVLLEATIDETGRVARLRVLKSVPELDQAAMDAVRQWVYEPVVIDGRPVGITFTVTICFRLD